MTEWTDFNIRFPVGADTDLDENRIQQLMSDARSWEERYRQLLLLTKNVPSIPNEWRQSGNEVRGCESHVWLLCYKDDAGKFHFSVDSDSRIVKALLITILAAVNHQPADKLQRIQVVSYIDKLGFTQHISPSRTNGLLAAWKIMNDFCSSFA